MCRCRKDDGTGAGRDGGGAGLEDNVSDPGFNPHGSGPVPIGLRDEEPAGD